MSQTRVPHCLGSLDWRNDHIDFTRKTAGPKSAQTKTTFMNFSAQERELVGYYVLICYSYTHIHRLFG